MVVTRRLFLETDNDAQTALAMRRRELQRGVMHFGDSPNDGQAQSAAFACVPAGR